MCGIAGILEFAGKTVSNHAITSLTKSLRHRGPDALVTWISENEQVGLGHARLAILDLSEEANQPMVSPSGRHTIVFNGEIYNFLEITEQLRSKGYVFRTRSDTEVILHAWDCWGQGMLSRLNGMWAFAIYDNQTGQTTLCRDRFGVKPLYYHHLPSSLIFGSEVQAIDRFTEFRLDPDKQYLSILSRFEIADRSCLEGVKGLLPGHLMTIDKTGQATTRQWYWLSEMPVPKSLQEQAGELKSLVIDACRLRLRSDVPVATCLSGGIDSGTLVSLLHGIPGGDERFPGFNHQAFTAAFPGTHLDETEPAKMLAAHFGIKLDIEEMLPPDTDELELAMTACDGPMPTLAFYSIWKLYRHIRQQGVKVTLDGIGPDEALGGYYLGAEALASALQSGNLLRLRDLYRTYGALYPDYPDWIRGDLKQAARSRFAALKRGLKPESEVTARDAASWPGLVPPGHPDQGDPLAMALWQQFCTAPLPFFLHQYDRASMANGVECRMPFMDYRVVEYMLSLPLESRVGGGYTKRVLREAVQGVLPDSIRLNKRKTGFNSPFAQWVGSSLKEWVLDVSTSSDFVQSPYFDGAGLSAEICRSVRDSGKELDERRHWPALHTTHWQANRCQLRSAA